MMNDQVLDNRTSYFPIVFQLVTKISPFFPPYSFLEETHYGESCDLSHLAFPSPLEYTSLQYPLY